MNAASATSHYASSASADPNAPENWREMRKHADAAKWQESCDEEMQNLRQLGCWTVVSIQDVPRGTPIMGSRWTYRAKTDENGNLTRRRARFV